MHDAKHGAHTHFELVTVRVRLSNGLVGTGYTDWPGLAPGNLLEGRDLKPTLALEKLIASTCAEAFNLDPERTAQVLFPEDADRYKALPALLRRLPLRTIHCGSIAKPPDRWSVASPIGPSSHRPSR